MIEQNLLVIPGIKINFIGSIGTIIYSDLVCKCKNISRIIFMISSGKLYYLTNVIDII